MDTSAPLPVDSTLDPSRRSWVSGATAPGGDFPLQNLPFGVFRRAGTHEAPRVGVAIGDAILDVTACVAVGLLDDDGAALAAARACNAPALNALMARGAAPRRALRRALSQLLGDELPAERQALVAHALVPQDEAELFLPAQVGDYTDFYASVHHATNVGSMFRPDQPLLPNYKWVPIGYHGRASSVVVSGTPVRRPSGQRKGPDDPAPTVGPSRSLDYELELGVFIGPGNALGTPIPLAEAEAHAFGVCLLNDWSARDLQSWEYQPLGPFLAKSFATSVSPWVVTLEALAPFRGPLAPRAEGDPAPLPYLDHPVDRAQGGLALTLQVALRTAAMRAQGMPPHVVSVSRTQDLYWTLGQMITHHASNGCNLRPGDLLGSGTVSGPTPESRGCLLERTWRGAEPLTLPTGELRRFLEDGDEVVLSAWAERPGAVRIGLGTCTGVVQGAPAAG
jgi:fumarylacetoacetase